MAVSPEFLMRPSDLDVKGHLGNGAFGHVHLCQHVTLGQVVMKTLYTGYLGSEEKKKVLLEEATIMANLNHERVVKLLGIIIEDQNCSLVIELMPKGNLQVMLERVQVPLSVKGRIILELLEGLVYLTQKFVLHKDIKPENILLDKDFHIKIADLGLATCRTWTKLSKEESQRRSRMSQTAGVTGAGTLSYMAPEHLKSIHTPSTEKSDVYSFGIVIWVILTGQEPYQNARHESHIAQCVQNGDRPLQDSIPKDTPKEMMVLMVQCWDPKPEIRPTFKESYDTFFPFYMKNLNALIKEDLHRLRQLYDGPGELVRQMHSLTIDEYNTTDSPTPLLSTHRPESLPTEMSAEELESSVQTDAQPPEALEEKLQQELQYHRHGSYATENPSGFSNGHQPSGSTQRRPSGPQISKRPSEHDRNMSSVHTWSKPPASQVHPRVPPAEDNYYSMSTSQASMSRISSASRAFPVNVPHQPPQYNRQKSCTAYPVNDTAAPDACGHLYSYNKSISLPESTHPSLYIKNAKGVQIGSNNTLHLNTSESLFSTSSTPPSSLAFQILEDDLKAHEDCAVTDKHFDYLVEHIGTNWKRCARRLGFGQVEIQRIEHDYRLDGLEEMVHQMLKRWQMREGSIGCTMGRLCSALKDLVGVEVMQHLLNNCQ